MNFLLRREKLIAFLKVLICLLTVTLLLRLLTLTASAQSSDVKGTTQSSQKFETHTVLKGETLYSLAKEHSISIDRLLELNPQIINNNLEAGTDIKLPVNEYGGIGPKPYLVATYYKVSAGETLYSIGKKTGNEVEVLKMWNDLKSNIISIDQKLIVGYGEGSTAAPIESADKSVTADATEKTEKKATTEATGTKEKNSKIATADKTVKPKTTPVKTTTTATTKTTDVTKPAIQRTGTDMKNTTAAVPDKSSGSVYSYPKTDEKLVYLTQKGLCTWIRGNSDKGKFYALHPTAPIGSSISVKNMMNSKSIQVKVIGRLPATPENENIAIKISSSAAKQLGAVDDKFLVSLSYMGYESMKATTMK